MTDKVYNVLFLCTGNSARSIIAESILDHWGKGQFRGFSAGSHATGHVNPLALKLLTQFDLPTAGLRSKSWDEFATPGSPRLDFVLTVCDKAAGEVCPYWPGQPMTAHWGIPDPAAARGNAEEIQDAYRSAFVTLERRIDLFLSLPLATIDELAIKREVEKIGHK